MTEQEENEALMHAPGAEECKKHRNMSCTKHPCSSIWAAGLLAAVCYILLVPLVLKPHVGTYDELDETLGHYPTILGFRQQFPDLDLINYSSATTPLYHGFIAVVSLVVGTDLIALRTINLLFSACCVGILCFCLAKRAGTRRGLLFTLPFMLSPYFVGAAVRISTDNAALLFALLAFVALETEPPEGRRSLRVNLLISILVLIRQNYAWFIAAYMIWRFRKPKDWAAFAKLARTASPVLIPISALAMFVWIWGGLTPPSFAERHVRQTNLDAPVYIISLIALYCAILLPWRRDLLQMNRPFVTKSLLLIALSVGFLLLHPVSNAYDRNLRGGMLWAVAENLPVFLGTSIIYWILFPAGLVCLYRLFSRFYTTQNKLMFLCLSLWLCSSVVMGQTYQKYYEPFLLFFLAYLLAPMEPSSPRSWFGPVLLSLIFLVIDVQRFS